MRDDQTPLPLSKRLLDPALKVLLEINSCTEIPKKVVGVFEIKIQMLQLLYTFGRSLEDPAMPAFQLTNPAIFVEIATKTWERVMEAAQSPTLVPANKRYRFATGGRERPSGKLL